MGLSQVRGKTEDLAEGVVALRRGQTAGFNKEIGQIGFPKFYVTKFWVMQPLYGRALPDREVASP